MGEGEDAGEGAGEEGTGANGAGEIEVEGAIEGVETLEGVGKVEGVSYGPRVG